MNGAVRHFWPSAMLSAAVVARWRLDDGGGWGTVGVCRSKDWGATESLNH